MINLAVSLGLGLLIAVTVRLLGFPLYAGVIPGTIAFLGTFIVLGRRTYNQIQKVMGDVQNELQSIPQNAKERERKARVEKVVKMLEAALPLGKWQFLVEAQIWGQIGSLKYLFEDYDGAQAAFAKSSPRDSYVRAMQGALAYKKKDSAAMTAAFEDAVNHGKKDGMMWAAYAWCLLQLKEKDKALKVLARAVEENPNDEKLKSALTAVQNDKRLKMGPWEPAWFNLRLEAPQQQQAMFVQRGPRQRFRG
jgi:tetratricopeptide (TPR) repeat protein